MRVLLVSSSSGSRGGGELFLLYLGEALKAANHEPMLWCASHPRMDELAKRFESIGPVLRDPYPNSYFDRRFRVLSAVCDWGLIGRLGKRFQTIPCDVIHLNKQTLEDGLDLLEAVQMGGKPVLSTIHITQSGESLGAMGGWLRDFIAIRSLRGASSVPWVAVSDGRASELERLLGVQVSAIYNAVSERSHQERAVIRKELLASRDWPENSLLVVCLGRLVAQKNPERFLRMAARLFQIDPLSRFLWIGGGEEQEKFAEQAQIMGLGNIVDSTGWLSEPRSLLAGADLYLHPAIFEGLPLAILEAMAAGLPCVLSEEIASEMKVFDSENVITAKKGDDAWLAKAASSTERSKYAAASLRLYQSHFRMEAMARAYMKLYTMTMSGGTL